MKTLKLTSLLIVLVLGFTSCTSEEENLLIQNETSESLLKSYEIQRNADGSYYVDYKTTGASSDNVRDKQRNENNINLYADNTETSRTSSQDLGFITDGDQLKINFNDTKADKVTSLKVIDDNIRLEKQDNELLKTFKFKNNGDGSYDLDYVVEEDVVSHVEYNHDLGVYDVILEVGKSTESKFFHTFTPDEENFEIHFVTKSNSESSRENEEIRKPKVVNESGSGGSTGG